ncbi:hypothetical protein HDU78_003330 [Chytriomyces hyalinus]|nr:hypothetical protein HDU78_003330 [Chytriomyces hyalinus]
MQGKCPSCRQPIQAGEIMRVQPPAPDVAPDNDANGEQDGEGSDGGEKLDPDMVTVVSFLSMVSKGIPKCHQNHYQFGSKIREMVKYIRQETEKLDEHRFILFIQFSDLADLVSAALNPCGVFPARIKRGWRERENAPKFYIYAPDPDPDMTMETYERGYEQNEAFGLNDLVLENYGENSDSETFAHCLTRAAIVPCLCLSARSEHQL